MVAVAVVVAENQVHTYAHVEESEQLKREDKWYNHGAKHNRLKHDDELSQFWIDSQDFLFKYILRRVNDTRVAEGILAAVLDRVVQEWPDNRRRYGMRAMLLCARDMARDLVADYRHMQLDTRKQLCESLGSDGASADDSRSDYVIDLVEVLTRPSFLINDFKSEVEEEPCQRIHATP